MKSRRSASRQLQAHSSEYCLPALGVIFLRHATNRDQTALKAIQADQDAGAMPKRPLSKADFIKRRVLMLPEFACYDTLLKLPSGTNLGAGLVTAMDAIEADVPPLAGKIVAFFDIEAADWSLTPGRFVGVAQVEVDEDFDFEQTQRDIHVELAGLDRASVEPALKIQENFEELGV